MTKLTVALTLLTTLAFSNSVLAAGYLKIEGVKGESTNTEAAPKPNTQIKKAEDEQTTGLLLPAVQKVREAPARSTTDSEKKKGKVEATWKVEEGEK